MSKSTPKLRKSTESDFITLEKYEWGLYLPNKGGKSVSRDTQMAHNSLWININCL